jgi:protein TonB
MFDSVTRPQVRGRVGTGAVLSVALHALALLLAVCLGSRPEAVKAPERVLRFFTSLPHASPSGAVQAKAPTASRPAHPRVRHRPSHPVVGRALTPQDVPELEAGPAPELDLPGAVAGIGAPGMPGTSDSPLGVAPGAGVGEAIQSFAPERGMTLPRLVSGEQPGYTREALEAGVEGTLIARCVLTAEGRVTGCRILKGLPHLNRSVLETLEHQRYTPVTLAGEPIPVAYVFRFHMRLPGR